MNITAYYAGYYAFELTKRCSSDSSGKITSSLADARVNMNQLHYVDAE